MIIYHAVGGLREVNGKDLVPHLNLDVTGSLMEEFKCLIQGLFFLFCDGHLIYYRNYPIKGKTFFIQLNILIVLHKAVNLESVLYNQFGWIFRMDLEELEVINDLTVVVVSENGLVLIIVSINIVN